MKFPVWIEWQKLPWAVFSMNTNVFAPYKAEYRVFERDDEWPPLSCGRHMRSNIEGFA